MRRIDPEAIEIIEQHLIEMRQTWPLGTKSMHWSPEDGYAPDRYALHVRIINSFKRQNVCIARASPICILTGGVPASGKTSFLRTYAPWMTGDELQHIDADEVRARLPEYNGWNADFTHRESQDIVRRLLDAIAIPCAHDLTYDGTMNHARHYEPLIANLKALGFRVFTVFLYVRPEVSKQRALERYRTTGRYVPKEVIDGANRAGLSAFDKVRDMSDGWILADGEDPGRRVIESGGERIPRRRIYTVLARGRWKRSEENG